MTPVHYEVREGIGIVTLNRPERLNAINSALLDGLVAALERAVHSDEVEVVLLRANGRAFCVGDDLDELGAMAPDAAFAHDFVARLQRVTRLIMLGGKPVVCAAHGWIVGGGAAWPVNADFALLADDAVLFCPEAGLGLFPSGGMTFLLAERCGPAAANEVLWLGARRSAQQLFEQHVVARVVPRARLDDEGLALALALRALPAVSRGHLKRARQSDLADRLERALALEAEYCVQAALDPATRQRAAAVVKR